MRKEHIGFLLLTAIVLAVIAVLTLPRPAAAQCGSSVSSCKNCHEVQKQKPVNTVGAWHTAHAFGDFCEFCHGGNVKAKDKTAAHAGMVDPLSDVKGSCQSCHPNDYMDRAKQYATALGKTIGTSSAPASPASASGVSATTPVTGTAPCGPAAPTGGQTIDLNKIYAAGSSSTPSTNVGNIVLAVLLVGVLALFAGLVWYYEHPLERAVAAWRQLLATPVVATTPEGIALNIPEWSNRPEWGALQRALASSDPATVRAVAGMLNDRENGPRILKALSHMDLQSLAALSESDQKTLATLLALAKEMKS